MKLLICAFLFLLTARSMALEGKTFVYFINGDWHYQGPVFEDEKIRLKDQANVIYREMVKVAKKDKKNNYVLFYDPLGEGQLFNRKWVKLRVYKEGRRVFGLGLDFPEINANSPAFHQKFQKIIQDELGVLKKEDSLFYYYGEHFPAYGELTLDLGGDDSDEDRGVGLKKILNLMRLIGPFHTAIFHTCYMNALDFVGPLVGMVDQVIVPEKAIINTHQSWSALSAQTFDDFGKSFAAENSNEKYRWLVYGGEVLELQAITNRLYGNVEQGLWNSWLEKQKSSQFSGLKQRGDKVLFLTPLSETAPKEVFVPLYDYINLINQFLLAGDSLLDDLDLLLEEHPNLDYLYQQVIL